MERLGEVLASVNALLNATSAALLVAGFWAIRTKRPALHRKLMLAALGASAAFLVSYLSRVALTGTHRYPGTGLMKTIYLSVLGSHTLLAALVVPLVLWTVYLSLFRGDFARHRRIARVTLPVWIYVGATGVVVYVMLYRFAA